MKEKKTLVNISMDWYIDTDITVLKHLAEEYHVVWFYIYQSHHFMKLSLNDVKAYAEKYGIDLHVVEPHARRRSLKYCAFFFRMADEINQYNPDVVCHAIRDPYWSIAVKTKLKCKNVVLGIHDVLPHSSIFNLSTFLDRRTRTLSIYAHRHIITFSSNQHDLLKKHFHRESYMVGMSCKYQGDSKLVPGPIESSVKLLFFGAIGAYKGLDLLIAALENMRSKGVTNISLTIAGRGEFWKLCEEQIRTKEMYNLQIRFIDSSEIPDLMCSHHFLALPYRDATQSGPLATAVAYQLPVIAPDFGCFAETYSHESAVLYKQGMLEDALLKISQMSSEEYSAMKRACRKVKEAYSEENIAKNYVKAFNGIISNSSLDY